MSLAACGAEPQRAEPQPSIRPGPDGIRINNSNLRIDFGRAQPGVIAAVSRLRESEPEISVNPECGAGVLTLARYAEGLTLLFQNNDFVGWTNASSSIYATNKFGPGATRAAVETTGVRIRETSLGYEFELEGVFGLIEEPGPVGQVTLMWAGTTCFFR